MRKSKVMMHGNGIVTCFCQREVLKRIKELDESSWVEQAYKGNGFVGFNVTTGEVDLQPGLTTIKLYEIPKNNKLSLSALQSLFWQKWQRYQNDLEKRVKFFYNQNCPLT